MDTISPATAQKRCDLLLAVERLFAPEPCVKGVVGVGSIAMNTASHGSDIDALVFMHPLDEYIAPAESIWCPWDDTFHSIFTEDRRVQNEGIQLDLKWCDLKQWRGDDSVWTEGQRAGLAEAWIAFDRDGNVAQLITDRTTYDDATRIAKLDSAVCTLEGLLLHDAPRRVWETLGPLIALDRLNAAYDALVQLLFALNHHWRPWREREMPYILRLLWLPEAFERRALTAINAPSQTRDGYATRASVLNALFDESLAELQREGFYGDDPIGEAFVRSHNEPGRAWNMAEWNRQRERRLKSR
jgi:hypothetical protein